MPIAHIAPAVVGTLVAAQASITATFPSHLGSDRQGSLLLTSYRGQTFNRLSSPITLLALLLASYRGQTFNRLSSPIALLALLLASYRGQRFNRLFSVIASIAIIYTNKLN